ncbi:hypothetical protein [Parerythrobacter lacustris]|uniref:DUF4189 domain-containing protein n=1 Tax=Parerythrobacter lacustris TaxID=2969984 RepID=A0ABT1XNL5_9SPHN|nr:hypothetical protein [Parerythrobacter lacustris]MCR2833254.1 hypothetical protein [Parerythrobacter lacustris]
MWGLRIEYALFAGLAAAIIGLILKYLGYQHPATGPDRPRYRPYLIALSGILFVGLLYLQARTGRGLDQHLGCAIFGCETQPLNNGGSPVEVRDESAFSSCVRELKAQFTCEGFLEYASRSDTVILRNDPRNYTLDEPIELAVAIAQTKLIVGDQNYNACQIFEESVRESCKTLSNVGQSDLGSR